jgi:hypothetical protein
MIVGVVFSWNLALDGGGMSSFGNSSPTLIDCVFQNNQADMGGGMYCWDSSPTILNCDFLGNSALDGSGFYCHGISAPALTDCLFSGNSGESVGGGAYCTSLAEAAFTNCTFVGNSAGLYGGGVACWGANPTLTNCTLFGNSASVDGGAIYILTASPVLEKSIISFNLSGGSVFCLAGGNPILTCCDVFGNVGGDWVSCIADQFGQNGNIAEDPLFCDPESDDFRLSEDSPCAPFTPPNQECDLVGAWPVGCAPMAVPAAGVGGVSARLGPCVPNPFMGVARMQYALASPGQVKLTVHDATGRLVKTLDSGWVETGAHLRNWDGTDLRGKQAAGGIYFFRLLVERSEIGVQRGILLR